MAWEKKIYECVACVCFLFGTNFSVVAFFMAVGFLMGVMTISFALPIDFYNFFGIQKVVSLQRFSFTRFQTTIKFTMTTKKTIYNFYQF